VTRYRLFAAAVFCLVLLGVRPGEAEPLPEFVSVDGVLTATLTAAAQTLRLGDATIKAQVYNGTYAGPMLRVHPGDLMRIRLINHLSKPTNLHFHGIATSPRGHGDTVFIIVAPGESFDYEIPIPKTQPPGLYWYHAHLHGIAEEQVNAGLSGPLVVEGFAAQFPELGGISERILTLKEWAVTDAELDAIDNGTAPPDPVSDGPYQGRIQSINGRTEADFTLRPGETQLWQIANQGANLPFHLRLAGHRFRIIGVDGTPTRKETVTETLEIPPAGRVEVLIEGGAPGRYDLISEKVLTGSGSDHAQSRVLGHVVVGGAPVESRVGALTFPALADLTDAKIDATRRLVFSQNPRSQEFLINDQLYDHERVDIRVPLGTVEEWTLRNESDDFHDFHIHQTRFQVMEIDGVAQPFDGLADVVRLPERTELKIRLAFTDPLILGNFVYHCHVLKHEDKGMMANIEVYDPVVENSFEARAGRFWDGIRHWFRTTWTLLAGLPPAICRGLGV